MIKVKKNELDVDFIGGLGALTKEEESAISGYLKDKKVKRSASYGKRFTQISATTKAAAQ